MTQRRYCPACERPQSRCLCTLAVPVSLPWRLVVLQDPSEVKNAKGSVALDGVSLTVNEVLDDVFGVNIIPHTASVTTFGARQVGDRVNLEIDLLARYLARLIGKA